MTIFPVELPSHRRRSGLRRLGATATVAVVVSACAGVAQPLAQLVSPPQTSAAVTPFGGPVSIDVHPQPIERFLPPRVSYSAHEIACGKGAATGTTCFTTLP